MEVAKTSSVPISQLYKINYMKLLGEGLTSKVYKSTRKSDQAEVAIKVLRRNDSRMTTEMVQCIKSEVEALTTLNDHKNIVKLFGMHEDKTNFYIIMEYIPRGVQLLERIHKKQYYTEMDVRDLCIQMLNAIQYCHSKDIVHRDFKPENIVVLDGSDGAVTLKLIDFGFASFAIGNTLTGTKGTAPYMAPEIWNKELYGKPVDMWAIGVTLYVLLCGEFPFPDKHKTKAEMINDIKVGSFAFLSENWGIVSSEAKDFLSKLLMVNPDVRLTAEAALDHPWITHCSDDLSSHSLEGTHKILKARKRLRAAVKAIMAARKFKRAGADCCKARVAATAATTPTDTAITTGADSITSKECTETVSSGTIATGWVSGSTQADARSSVDGLATDGTEVSSDGASSEGLQDGGASVDEEVTQSLSMSQSSATTLSDITWSSSQPITGWAQLAQDTGVQVEAGSGSVYEGVQQLPGSSESVLLPSDLSVTTTGSMSTLSGGNSSAFPSELDRDDADDDLAPVPLLVQGEVNGGSNRISASTGHDTALDLDSLTLHSDSRLHSHSVDSADAILSSLVRQLSITSCHGTPRGSSESLSQAPSPRDHDLTQHTDYRSPSVAVVLNELYRDHDLKQHTDYRSPSVAVVLNEPGRDFSGRTGSSQSVAHMTVNDHLYDEFEGDVEFMDETCKGGSTSISMALISPCRNILDAQRVTNHMQRYSKSGHHLKYPPIKVRRMEGGRYVIVDGNHRYKALQLLQKTTIACIIEG